MAMNIPKILQYFPLLLGSFCACPLPLAQASTQSPINIEFKDDGSIVGVLFLNDLHAIAPAVSIKVFEAHEKGERIYRALPVRPVFDRMFGKNWEKAQEITFTTTDGYQPSIPVAKFLAHDAYFAFAHDDGTPFTLVNRLQNDEVAQLGPLYLIWNNIKSKELLDAGASDMPYQIRSVELKFVALFPNMIPPAGSSAEVKRGFMHFRQYCMACHTINGEGGGKAPELNYPVNVTEYIKPEYLKRWILSPQSIRYNTRMPGLTSAISERETIAEELVVYLKAMSNAKRAPAKP